MLNIAENSNYINVVSDQIGSPTNAFDLACAILKILLKSEMKMFKFIIIQI